MLFFGMFELKRAIRSDIHDQLKKIMGSDIFTLTISILFSLFLFLPRFHAFPH